MSRPRLGMNEKQRYDSTPSERGKKPQDRGLMGANAAINKDGAESGEETDEHTVTVEEAKQDG